MFTINIPHIVIELDKFMFFTMRRQISTSDDSTLDQQKFLNDNMSPLLRDD